MYSNLAQSQILFYMHQRPMVPDRGNQYEENESNNHEGMHEDGLDPFLYALIPHKQFYSILFLTH